jgi:hypothetical protein
MLWYHHLFMLWVLAHMAWAAVILEREWRRARRAPAPNERLDKAYPLA